MSGKYDDIINMTRPQYNDLPQMSREARAAQFSPFAAVVGYDDAVEETARLTDSRIMLGEDEMVTLNQSLALLRESLDKKPRVLVTFFVPDARKSGGSYLTKDGIVKRLDEYENEIVFEDGTKVRIDDVISVELMSDGL
ncbi:MAG: hypothetical protein IJ757_05260 [Clostridiales bacterium]|nr:hypothetical protein [Clostridiales bacterium]